ncbi:mucin-5AC-like isoform X1 [Carassius gibelio]|uniref:mucin-5AC-like isoform X1 n=1 Tax=Carassius gibelio TaxID=101364 RepID=UPI0022787109|nr:mucin-5AC-like isoform X1 [Carassius gibelio]XP_052454496.1 mucin-5AC-like isoform X1 [Carassius gibelio]XP_052454497.1 mucin-5AC-like isoform X1 [Carassius gibelio]
MVHTLLLDNMVSKEPNHLPTVHSHSNGNPDKTPTTVTVRSVLLNRNSPDIESRLKRRRNRTQQVRFKDLEYDDVSNDKNEKMRSKSPTEVPNWQKELTNGPSLVGAVRGDMEKTIGAVTAFLKRAPPHPLTPGPARRCWVPTHPCSLTLPLPTQPCKSTAIQTSPSLQKPPSLSATQTRSHSLGGAWEDGDSSDELTAHVYIPPCRSKKSSVQHCTPAEQSRCKRTEDNQTASVGTSTQKQSRRRCRRKSLNRAGSDPGKPEPHFTSPTKTVHRSHQQSKQPKKLPSKAVAHRTSPDIVSMQCSHTPNTVHNMPCSVSSTQTEARIESKIQTVPDNTTSLQKPKVDPASCPSHTAPPTSTTCSKETSQCCPQHAAAENISLTPTVLKPLYTTTAQVLSTVTTFSTHRQSCMSLTESTGHCCTPAIQNTAKNTPPLLESQRIPESHTDPTAPGQSMPCFQKLEETIACSNTVGSKAVSCSQGAPAVASTFISTQPCQKTPTQPMSCDNTSNQPVYSGISPTQPVTCIQSVPRCMSPKQNEPLGRAHNLPVQTPKSATHTPTPVQSTSSCKNPMQSIQYCVKDKLASCATVPHPVSHFKGPVAAAAHAIPIAQTAVHCILDQKNVVTHVTPSMPVLICSSSTQPAPGTLSVQALPHCNSSMQNAVSCSNPSQIVQPFKTVSHSKPFPQNMSPILCPRETIMYASKPQETVLPSANFRHSLPSYACPPQTTLLYSNAGANPSPPQAFCCTQDRRDRREFMLPPPPPPPPPYTPRKEGSSTPGHPRKPPVPKAESYNAEKDGVKTGAVKPNAEAVTHYQAGETPPPIPPKSKARAMVRPTCLSVRRVILGPESQANANHLPPTGGTNPQAPLGQVDGQADTLRQVQELLGGLMSGTKCKLDLAKAKEKLFGPNGPLYDIGALQSQLHNLEGVLETSQNTIKVLLDVIQDLEKKEAERDGRHTYRTGQDIENCGTCRDCACIIYSVEHDFRLQEGQVTRAWKVPEHQESEQSSPQLVFAPPHQQDSPQALQTVKKSRRKCFWFL